MIRLKLLKWSNCFSYGPDNVLELDNNIITQIVGTNGTGKSSIPLIVEEVLFNRNSKNTKKVSIPNRYLGKGYYIYLLWEKDGDTYEITVNRSTSIKVKLEKNGVDISSHTATNTYKTVQEIIGSDFKTFSQLVYQSSNASLQFLTATDTNRKKFLIDLLHLEEYVKLFEVFKEAARQVNIETVGVQANIATIDKWLTDNKLTDTTILPMLDLQMETEDDEKELRQLSKEIENISEKNKKISKNEQYKKLLKDINLKEIQTTDSKEKRSYDKLQTELGEHSAAITGATRLTTKLRNLGDTCPTCEQPVDSTFKLSLIEAEQLKIEQAEMRSKQLETIIAEIKNNNRLFERRVSIQKTWEELYRSIDKGLPDKFLDEEQLKSSLDNVQERLFEAKALLAKTARENERRTQRNTRIQVIQEQTNSFIEELTKNQKTLAGRASLLSNLEILKKAFSTNGLIAYKIENLVKELEEMVNTYLAELSDGRFTLEFVVTNDKLNVEITDDGNVVDISDLSSGELARVNTATLIAIRKLMSSISESRINVLFLDEVINVLDEVGREKLIEVLLQEKDLNTYVVSHGWTHPLLEKVEVVKENNISRLEK